MAGVTHRHMPSLHRDGRGPSTAWPVGLSCDKRRESNPAGEYTKVLLSLFWIRSPFDVWSSAQAVPSGQPNLALYTQYLKPSPAAARCSYHEHQDGGAGFPIMGVGRLPLVEHLVRPGRPSWNLRAVKELQFSGA